MTAATRTARPGALAVVAVVAAALCGSALLRRQPLSWDESVTASIAVRPVHAIAQTVSHTDAALGTYYLLMHGWSTSLGRFGIRMTEIWWRLPSAAGAVVTAVLVALVARRIAGNRAALVSGVLVGVLPLFGFYATDARPYALASAVALGAWALWTSRSAPSWWTGAGVALLLATAAYLQLFTVLVWPALLFAPGRFGRPRTLVVLAAATAGVLPLALRVGGQSAEIAWIPAASWSNTAGVLVRVGGGVAALAAVALVVGLGVSARVVGTGPYTRAMLWWAVAPAVLLAALDVVRPVLVARYAVVSLPVVALGCGVVVARAAAAARRPRRRLRAAGATLLVACAVTSVIQAAKPYKYEDYRAAVADTREDAPAGSGVLFVPSSTRLGWEQYTHGAVAHDLALPNGIGPDPLGVRETPHLALQPIIAAQCDVVVIGDPVHDLSSGLSADDRYTLETIEGWTARSTDRFGELTVTVLRNPRCTGVIPPVR